MMNRTRKLVYIAILVAQAMVLNYVERLIPISAGIPGAKLGLANIVTLLSLLTLTKKTTFSVILVRITLGAVMFGSMSSFFYALSGAVLSFIVMAAMLSIPKPRFSILSISMIGAAFHNIGQLLVASLVIETTRIFYYLPFLLLVAIPTGLFVGLVSRGISKHIKKHGFLKDIH